MVLKPEVKPGRKFASGTMELPALADVSAASNNHLARMQLP